jgi:hypothetical protein
VEPTSLTIRHPTHRIYTFLAEQRDQADVVR